jgi:riboflavin synthase
MFTGIVEELGQVVELQPLTDSARLRVRGEAVTEGTGPGDSIAVNGVCLTVVDVGDGEFTADVMRESLDRSNLGSLAAGDLVNLERSVRADGRLGGHIVQGHVDGVAVILDRTPSQQWEIVRFGLPDRLVRYVAEKGSVTVDGISLTVVEVGEPPAGEPAVAPTETAGSVTQPAGLHNDRGYFSVALTPTTLELTTLGHKRVGDPVNVEVDVLAKYVERLLGAALAEPNAVTRRGASS